jgi:hypothetical protein
MDLYRFTLLDEAEQFDVFRQGVLVGRLSRNGFIYECRQVDYFYVEWRMDPKTGQYVSLRTFTNPKGLDRYLADMDLSWLWPGQGV